MIDEQIIELYDNAVAAHPEGIKVADAKDAIRDAVRELALTQDRNIDREVNMMIDRAINPMRNKRSQVLARDLEYILDSFANPEEAALIPDQRMRQAFRLGTTDGADKSLGAWVASDFVAWALVRKQQAHDATEAAKEAEESAFRVVQRMHAQNARMFGDVDWTKP